jgi:hypothetical protein
MLEDEKNPSQQQPNNSSDSKPEIIDLDPRIIKKGGFEGDVIEIIQDIEKRKG